VRGGNLAAVIADLVPAHVVRDEQDDVRLGRRLQHFGNTRLGGGTHLLIGVDSVKLIRRVLIFLETIKTTNRSSQNRGEVVGI